MRQGAGSPSSGDAGETGARLAAITSGLAIAAALCVIVGHLLNELVLDGSIGELDARQEANTFTWASTVAAFAGALAAALHALLFKAHRVKLGLMAAGLALISFDDLVRVHERLGGRLAEGLNLPDAIAEGAELLLFGPLLLGVLIVGWMLVGELSARPASAPAWPRAARRRRRARGARGTDQGGGGGRGRLVERAADRARGRRRAGWADLDRRDAGRPAVRVAAPTGGRRRGGDRT
ncbi:MAG: hypothetical protein H0W09_05125 [Solirubrobacterales bacterium]|nr:hypothetical protein [Solirubrobacterales bacterium]